MPKCALCGMQASEVCLPDNTEFEKLDRASPIIERHQRRRDRRQIR
jgi:hypothetical protein